MYSKVYSAGLMGVEGFLVEVEVDISNGLPGIEFVGALGSEVKEAKERVKAALHHYNISFPPKRITVNLSPGDKRKEGCGFDLPIAVVLLQALDLIPRGITDGKLFLGELALDGSIRAVTGVLPLVLKAREEGFKGVVLPAANAKEGALVDGIDIYALSTLGEITDLSDKAETLIYVKTDTVTSYRTHKDFSDVLGQESLKRASLVAASGMHNMLITGPPGSGKSMIAERIPGILPGLSDDDRLELTKIYSVTGKLSRESPLITERPFRYVQHSITLPSLLGGGRIPRPGEVSLAHNGVLFIDEAPELDRTVLESLRQPLERGEVTVNRLNGIFTFPASFMLVASMNPCPCGYYPDREKCTCSEYQIIRYLKKISGPMLDRIDVSVEAKKVEYKSLSHKAKTDREWSTSHMKELVEKAVDVQSKRFRNEGFSFNSQIPVSSVNRFCKRTDKAEMILKAVYERMNLSARAYHRVLKVSRTIADLSDAKVIDVSHISEALAYRLTEDYFNGHAMLGGSNDF